MQKTLDNIEELFRTNSSLSAENTMKLLDLLTALKPEMEQLSIVQSEHAKNIAKHIERSAQDALRLQKDQILLQKNSEG